MAGGCAERFHLCLHRSGIDVGNSLFHPFQPSRIDPYKEDVGKRMPEVKAGRIDQGDVGGKVFIFVFGLPDPEFDLI